MDYIPEKLLQIVISFTILYTNVTNFQSHFLSEAKFTEMLEVPFHQEVSINNTQGVELSQEGFKNFEEFQRIMRDVYTHIQAPFESLKTAEVKYLTQLKEFLQDIIKMETLAPLLTYGGKQEWMISCENILSHFTDLDEF